MKKGLFFSIAIACLATSCANQSPSASEELDTPVSGKISMAVDETLTPIAYAQADIFHHHYEKAHITVKERSESDCIQDLYKDSVKTIMIGRKLDAKERAAFKAITFDPLETPICVDAIAFLVHPSNRDTNITYDQIMSILRGQTTNWSQVNGKRSGDINLVFDNANSGTTSYLLNMTGEKAMPKNAYAMKTHAEAVNYVASHENAIGIIGWSWVSDSDDPRTREFLKKTRLVSVSPKGSTTFYKPYQGNLIPNKYPLSREVYMITRERRAGLASGFTAFVHGEIGQLILLKAGLLPANQQERNIEIKVKPVGEVGNTP
ncbi:MAG: substrate-binding domain-containing protein [Saprospiraceae bacterium]|nr:substrate-binding domain-containing protein [Saprospiraceae bacterium]